MSTTASRQTAVGRPITKNGVAIFPVYQPGSTSAALGLDRPGEAFQIREKASPTVPILEVENTGATPVVLFAGETLEGGRQQRVLNQSVIIPGFTVTDIPVSCVEQGRWHGASTFRGVGAMAPAAIRRGASHRDQMMVWSEVNNLLSRVGVTSDTDSLDDFFASRPKRHDAATIDEVASWGPLAEQTGIVVMSGGKVVSADLFGETALLVSMWDTLIRSAFSSAGVAHQQAPNRADKALNFLRRFTREVRGPVGRSDFGLGEWFQVVTERVTGQMLTLDGALVHASAFPTAG
jgi:hypothetical protein